MPLHVVWLDEPLARDLELVGGKAVQLARLMPKFNIPLGFCLTSTALDGWPQNLAAPSINTSTLPPAGQCRSICDAYDELSRRLKIPTEQTAVAVRSSGIEEDMRRVSFAGQHDSYLNVRGHENVLSAIVACWKSFHGEAAVSYRRHHGLPMDRIRAAILVQALVPADSSAIVFSAHPGTGDQQQIVINACWGLGASIAAGTTSPDTYVVSKRATDQITSVIGEKARMTVRRDMGTEEVAVPRYLRGRRVLSDGQIIELAELALGLERETLGPVDVECSIDSDRLYLLQCRPITASVTHPDSTPARTSNIDGDPGGKQSVRPDDATSKATVIAPPPDFPVRWESESDPDFLWMYDEVHTPGVMSPMADALMKRFFRGANLAFVDIGVPLRAATRRINGYLYYAFLPTCPTTEFEDRYAAAMPRLRRNMLRLGTYYESEVKPLMLQYIQAWDSFDLSGAENDRLLAHCDDALEKYEHANHLHFNCTLCYYSSPAAFLDYYADLFGGDHQEAYKLLTGHHHMTFATDAALYRLGRRALELGVSGAICDNLTSSVIADLRATPKGAKFVAALDEFLYQFGKRSDGWNVADVSWIEEPGIVLQSLTDYIHGPQRDPEAELESAKRGREEGVTKARSAIACYPAIVRAEFEQLLAAAQAGIWVSEDHQYWIDAVCLFHIRQILLEQGRRCAEAGVVNSPDDVMALTLNELKETMLSLGRLDRKSLVEQRLAEMDRCRRDFVPPRFLGTPPPPPKPDDLLGRGLALVFDQPLDRSAETKSSIVVGLAASPGCVRGVARHVRCLAEAGRLGPGEILVTHGTSPAWTPLFRRAAGIVTCSGGILSHPAITARELQRPAVVGASRAMHCIGHGQTVEVDGHQGVVRILEN